MASKTGFGIDIGQDSIKLVELRKEKTGVYLDTVNVVPTGITPSLTRSEREDVLIDKLAEILQDVKIGNNPLTIAAPGVSAFIRYVKLPPVTSSRLQQIIGYEAQQQVPFPLEEVIWDYQILETSNQSETNVILVAIKSEVINNLIDAMSARGLELSVIEHRPIALYNCVRFNKETEGEVAIIIDIGARATDLNIEVGGELCWTRTARIGGGDITEAIQKELNISFEEAEELKKSKGIVCLNEKEEKSADEECRRIWQAMKPVVSEIMTELQRSVSYFHSQLGGGRVEKILLAGGCTRLENLDNLIKEQLGAEAERLNPVKNISHSPELFEGEDSGQEFGVAVGLALRSIEEAFSTIDLLPGLIIGRREMRKKRAYLMLSGLCMMFMLGISAIFSMQNHTVIELQLQNLSTELEEYNKYDGEIQKLAGERKEIRSRTGMLNNLVIARGYWADILLELSRVLPDNTYLTSFFVIEKQGTVKSARSPAAMEGARARGVPVSPGGRMQVTEPGIKKTVDPKNSFILGERKMLVQLSGRTVDFDAVTNLISRLEKSPVFGKIEVISAVSVEETAEVEKERESRTAKRQPGRRTKRTDTKKTEKKDVSAPAVEKQAGINVTLHVELVK